MKDKRKTKRRYLLYYMRVYDTDSLHQIGNLVDITTDGAMLICPDAIPPGKTIHLRLEVSPDVSDAPFVEFTARSQWCTPDLDPKLFDIGFEFTEIDPEVKQTIRRIVQTHGFRDNRL